MKPLKKKLKRVNHACDYCKIKRVKCSGDNPCSNCKDNKIICMYSKHNKRGRKIKISDKKYFEKFSDACNYLYNGVKYEAPIMNNGDSKYDILINFNILENLYNYGTFELIPFLNYTIIKNRINNRTMYFSLLFSLYSLSEILKPYADYSIAQKYIVISKQFIELCKLNKKINDIQIIETLFVISNIEIGNIKGYFFTKCALKIFLKNNIYNVIVPEYKEDNEEKKNYISLVYISVILKHMLSQITTGLIENVELTEPVNDVYFDINPEIEKNKFVITNIFEILNKYIKIYENQPKIFLLEKIKDDKNYLKQFKINKFTGKTDITDILLLKYNGNNIVSSSLINSLNFNIYMNQPSKWSVVVYYNITRLRNILFLYSNMNNNNLKFNSALLIEEDKEYIKSKNNSFHELRFSSTTHLTDPTPMFLYKRRLYATYISNRIFLYRVMIKLILKSTSSKDNVSNLQTNIYEENSKEKFSLYEKNKYLYDIYYRKNNYFNQSTIKKEEITNTNVKINTNTMTNINSITNCSNNNNKIK